MLEDIRKQLEEFRKQLPIDRDRLESEAAGQASLYESIGSFIMDLKSEARVKKDHLEFVRADIRNKIRANPASYGLLKPTVDAVEDACQVNTEYRAALTDSSDAQHLADAGFVMLEAAGQRKSTLRDVVSLFIHQYYMSSQDMAPEKKSLSKVSEEEVLVHRQRIAVQRVEDTKEENTRDPD